MSWRANFDDVLDAAIDAVRNGDHIDAVLARYPLHASALRPLLETASATDPSGAYVPPSNRLTTNFARVESALGRARWERGHDSSATGGSPWWSKRIAFASLSLPAGILAIALLGAGGAAAATLAASTGLPQQIADKVESVTPSWAHSIIPGGDDEDAAGSAAATATPGVEDATAPAASATSLPALVGTEAAPSSTPRGPQAVSVSGTITNVRGNTFELIAGDVTYKVQVDANTTVSGEIVEEATATVEGDLTGNDRLHATSVTAAAPPAPVDTPPEASPESPGQGDRTPGPPEKTHTPPGQADKTPPGQADKTKTPGPPATPPGQGGGNGNAGGNGNGNAGGNGNGNGGGN